MAFLVLFCYQQTLDKFRTPLWNHRYSLPRRPSSLVLPSSRGLPTVVWQVRAISREEGDQSSLARRVRALYAAQAAGTEAEREVAMGQARAAAAEGTIWARYSSVALPSMSNRVRRPSPQYS